MKTHVFKASVEIINNVVKINPAWKKLTEDELLHTILHSDYTKHKFVAFPPWAYNGFIRRVHGNGYVAIAFAEEGPYTTEEHNDRKRTHRENRSENVTGKHRNRASR